MECTKTFFPYDIIVYHYNEGGKGDRREKGGARLKRLATCTYSMDHLTSSKSLDKALSKLFNDLNCFNGSFASPSVAHQ